MALQEDIAEILSSFGLGSMAEFVIAAQKEGKDNLTIITELRQRPEYKMRFPAMAELQRKAQAGKGVAITEGQYLEMERSYRQVFQASGLPMGMWDTPDDFKRLLESDVSPAEAQERVGAAKEAVDSTDPNVRSQLAALYGISATDLVAYALDPEKNSDYLRRIATSARLAGYSQTAGMGSMSKGMWEGYAQDLINQQISDEGLRDIVSSADSLAESQSRLAGIEGGTFTGADALDVAVRKDSDKAMASQRRVDREKARFGGSSGVTSGTLAKSGI